MLGPASNVEVSEWLERDSEIPLAAGKLSLADFFHQQWGVIDLLLKNGSDAGKMLGVDDALHRLIALLFAPEKLLGAEVGGAAGSRQLNHVCDYIDAHLTEPLTLTRIEEISGMSRRSLQYAFLKRFGCTPMEWVRERRLDWAHRQLAEGLAGVKVIEVALNSGFAHLANFSRRYRQRFGETPSQTLSEGRKT
jgi:AraC-like DNA-binding protein